MTFTQKPIYRDKGQDSDDNSDTANNNGDGELPSLESVFSDGSESSLRNQGVLPKLGLIGEAY